MKFLAFYGLYVHIKCVSVRTATGDRVPMCSCCERCRCVRANVPAALRVCREKSRPADLMYRSGLDGRVERFRRYVTDVPAGYRLGIIEA